MSGLETPADGVKRVQPGPVRRDRLALAVLDDLIGKVVGGQFAPGSTFPSELELCEMYGVSRTVIRESMRSLEERGLADIRQGQGTTVAPFDRWNLLDPVVLDAAILNDETLATLDDLVTVRVALESQMAGDAAARITDEELAELKTFLDKLASEIDAPGEYVKDDVLFHDIIMRASRNALAKSVVSSVHLHARASNRYTGLALPEELLATHESHIRIYERLAAHDVDGARAAMHDHILGAWRRRRQSTARDAL
jgi:DNA-binding FadR family transcriptional regulator